MHPREKWCKPAFDGNFSIFEEGSYCGASLKIVFRHQGILICLGRGQQRKQGATYADGTGEPWIFSLEMDCFSFFLTSAASLKHQWIELPSFVIFLLYM